MKSRVVRRTTDTVEIKPYCREGIRNDFLKCLSGRLRKENVSIESAFKAIDALTDDDEEKQERFTTLEAAYSKVDVDDVCGYAGFLTNHIEYNF